MRLLLAIIMLSTLCGCGTIGAVRRSVFGDPTIEGKDKIGYASLIEEKEAQFREFRETHKGFVVFQYAAVATFLFGLFMLFIKKTDTVVGIGMMVASFILSGWGLIAPNNLTLVTIMMCLAVVLGGAYVVYSIVRKEKTMEEKRNKEPSA